MYNYITKIEESIVDKVRDNLHDIVLLGIGKVLLGNVMQQSKKNDLNNKYTIVSSILIATEKNPEVKINWRVYTKDPANPLIRDLIIEGLSLARTQKEEFISVIQSNDGDINALFVQLSEFINK